MRKQLCGCSRLTGSSARWYRDWGGAQVLPGVKFQTCAMQSRANSGLQPSRRGGIFFDRSQLSRRWGWPISLPCGRDSGRVGLGQFGLETAPAGRRGPFSAWFAEHRLSGRPPGASCIATRRVTGRGQADGVSVRQGIVALSSWPPLPSPTPSSDRPIFNT